jgi:hypothetical protein
MSSMQSHWPPFLLLCLAALVTGSVDIYVNSDFQPLKSIYYNATSLHQESRASRLLSSLDKQPIEPNTMFRSPNEGTDVVSKPAKIVNCDKQTHCIAPALQLEKTFNVYYCKRVSHGVRFYYLVREGLTLHPRINLVESPEEAEVVVYLPESANWAKSECNNPAYYSKVGHTVS